MQMGDSERRHARRRLVSHSAAVLFPLGAANTSEVASEARGSVSPIFVFPSRYRVKLRLSSVISLIAKLLVQKYYILRIRTTIIARVCGLLLQLKQILLTASDNRYILQMK